MYAIYGLRDPRDQKVFYVGQTTDVYKRFIEHISCSSNNLARNTRIVELRKLNLMVVMEVFELVGEQEKANESEAYWIRHFEHLQHPLTNIALMSQPKRSRRDQYKAAKSRMTRILKHESEDLKQRMEVEIVEPPIDPNSIKIGLDQFTKREVMVTKEQFEMLLLKRKSGLLTGYRQIMKIIPTITESHARNLNKMLLNELARSQHVEEIKEG